MSDYESLMSQVRRERETEQKIRNMDTGEIVELIHALEDQIAALEEERGDE